MDEWSDFTERNLSSSEKQRRNSVRVRSAADAVLQSTCNDINRQRSSSDLALQMRVDQMRDAKEKFEDHLNKVTPIIDIYMGGLGRTAGTCQVGRLVRLPGGPPRQMLKFVKLYLPR